MPTLDTWEPAAADSPADAHRTLSPRAAFWVAAAVAGLSLWASGAPSVVYPLYAQAWDLDATVTTAIFAIYPLVLIPVLLVFGNLSDVIGRRTTILIGIGTLAAGALAFGLAPNLAWVFVGRSLMGVGVGFALSPATAAMVELGGPSRAQRASSVTTAATATGLALATLVGGALVQYAPQPRHLTFWVLFVVTVAVGVLAWFLPRSGVRSAERWRPRALHLPRDNRVGFAAGAFGLAAAYSCGSVFLALGAQIARELIRSDNALVDGAVISVSAVVIGVVAILSRSLAPRRALLTGVLTGAIGFGVLLLAGTMRSLPLFLIAAVVSGVAYSTLFSGGLALVARSAPATHRGAVLSAAYSFGYVLQAVTALGLGVLATRAGLQTALVIGSPVIVALALVAFVLAYLPGRTGPVEPASVLSPSPRPQ